ncbi:hypothetical protein [Flavobacterium sp.]|uniref:hypothetical protein n=1 Tax=Flavobacterium sp. TaxID=239 RepID=UPI00374CB4F6
MKKFLTLSLLFTSFLYSQNKKSKIEYINMTSLSITKNTESYFSNFGSKDSKETKNGFGLDINTIHGAKFFDHIALSAGISLDWNINRTFLSTPLIFDLRAFSGSNAENIFFVYLQTGKNLKWSDSFNGNGTSSKFGAGVILEHDEDISYYVDIYKKSKQIYLQNNLNNENYNINGYGISLGVIF